MTPQQLTTLKAAILAETDPTFVTYRTNGQTTLMADFYSVEATPAFYVWKATYTADEIATGIDNGITQLDALTASKRDSLLWWAQRPHDMRTPASQAAVNDLCSSQNTLKAAVLDNGKRKVNRGERLYCTGTGSLAVPGSTTFEGRVSDTDISAALRQLTPGPSRPAWRAAMSVEDTVYEIGDAPSVAAARIDWPAAGAENTLYAGTDSNYAYMHFGYGGSVFVPEIGQYGAMVFGYTGEATFAEQMTVFDLSSNTPTWDFFQQPNYAISSAEAASMDADWYYSAADYTALDSGHKITNQATFNSTWDRGFPVGMANWVMRRKIQTSFLGNSRPHFFRYEMPRYIPPAMTGTTNGSLIVCSEGMIYGPFAQGPAPNSVPDADWYADVWGSPFRRKHYLYAMDVVTKEWQRLSTPIPDYARNSSEAVLPLACVDEVNQRVYYLTINSTDRALFYADFSSGLAGMTMSGPTNISSGGSFAPSLLGNSVLCVPVSGPNAGKRLWLFKNSGTPAALLLIDLDANTQTKLEITGLPATGDFWGFGYDAANNTVHITTKNTSYGMKNFRFVIPTDYTDQADYTVTSTTLDTSGVTIENLDSSQFQYGERNMFHPELGVIMMTQRYEKMLAYRPRV
jgi:hypothetical protein